jgi:hypothetical protein
MTGTGRGLILEIKFRWLERVEVIGVRLGVSKKGGRRPQGVEGSGMACPGDT